MIAQTESRDEQRHPPFVKVMFDVLVLLVSVLFLLSAYHYPGSTGLFAKVVGYPVSALGLLKLVLDLRKTAVAGTAEEYDNKTPSYRFPLVPLVLAVIYVLLFFAIGFIAASLLFLTLTPWLVYRQPLKRLPLFLITSVVLTGIFVALFGMGSGILLPRGLVGGMF